MTEHSLPDSFRDTGLYVHRANDKQVIQYQVLGERASATNLVRKVLQRNTKLMRTEALGWKHGVPHMAAVPDDFLVVVVVRNAVNWALSMHKRPWHLDPHLQELDFSSLIRTEWIGRVDRVKDFEEIHPEVIDRVAYSELQFDRHPITGRRFRNLFEMRTVKLQGMLGMLNRDCNTLVVRAEEVQKDAVGFAITFMETFNIEQRFPKVKPIARRLGNQFSSSVKNRPQTPSEMPEEDLAFMKTALDLDLEAQLGYSY